MNRVSVADHPRAAAAVARAKGLGGLVGFGVTALGSMLNGAVLFDAGLRALGGGIIGYFLGWSLAVAAWRSILQAEAKTAVEKALARRRAEAEGQ